MNRFFLNSRFVGNCEENASEYIKETLKKCSSLLIVLVLIVDHDQMVCSCRYNIHPCSKSLLFASSTSLLTLIKCSWLGVQTQDYYFFKDNLLFSFFLSRLSDYKDSTSHDSRYYDDDDRGRAKSKNVSRQTNSKQGSSQTFGQRQYYDK